MVSLLVKAVSGQGNVMRGANVRQVREPRRKLITKVRKYVTKFRLPPHQCESVPRIWRANIFLM
jgi:hypothetical protein